MVKSKQASSSHSAEATATHCQEVALRVASCNLQLDLDLLKFDPTLHVMIKFLKNHPLRKPLTKSTAFPLSIIHKAYSTAVYNSKEDYIKFDINEDKITKLSKDVFLKAIGLPKSKREKTFYEPTNKELFDVLDQMGYLPPRLETTPSFKKTKLPAMWQFLVHLFVRCLSGKTGGTDTINRPFLVLLFGIYTGKEVDFGTTIWNDFSSYVFPKKKEIPCARFWALALRLMYTKLKVPLPEGEKMFIPRIISRYSIPDQSDFREAASLPEAMLQYIDENSEVLIIHTEETGPSEVKKTTEGHTSDVTCTKQIDSKVKKTTGLGTKRKCETSLSPQAKRRLTQSMSTSQKGKNIEKRPIVGSQTITELFLKMNKWKEDELNAKKQREQEEREKIEARMNNDEIREEFKNKAAQKEQLATMSESKETEATKGKKRILREEQQKREEEEMVRTAVKLLEQAMSACPFKKTGEEFVEAMEEDFVFSTDEGITRDSESPPIMESVKPSKSEGFFGTSETESEHIKETGASTPRRLPKGKKKKKKKNSKYVSRVEFDSLNKKLSEVLEAVKKIPSKEKFVSKEDFGEIQKIVTSLSQTREKTIPESIVNSIEVSLKDMEQKRTDDTFKYLDKMDVMVKMVKEIQQSYDELSKQVQQSFLKVSELIHDLKGQRFNEAGPSSTKVGEDEDENDDVEIIETSDQHSLVNRELRDDELVPKQTTSPPSSDEYQWDIPMSPKARYYSVFQPLHPHLSREMQIPIELNRLETFYKAHGQPSKNVWSLRRIIKVLRYKKMSFQKHEYFGFEVIRSDNEKYFFSEADFPNLNPNDLYVIGRYFRNKALTHPPSRFPYFQIRRFLRSLIYDLGRIDVERFGSFVDNPPEEIKHDLEGIENRHRGPTEDPELGIIFSIEKDSPRLFFRLRQKHLCATKFLREMIDLTLRSRKASEELKVKIVKELEWWVAVRKWIKRVNDLVTNKI